MGLFRHYLRVFFRSHFPPINAKSAKKWELNASIFYVLFAWTALGFSVRALFNSMDKGHDISLQAFTPADTVRKFGLSDQATLISVRGLKVETENLTYDEVLKRSKNN